MKRAKTILILATVAILAGPALGDWLPEDGHKMHYPQLPDPDGWDVEIVTEDNECADDWECSKSGKVTDIHFWTSWAHDNESTEPIPGVIHTIGVTIYDNVPEEANGPHSHPGQPLWTRVFPQPEFTVRPYGTGDQGFYHAAGNSWEHPDHQLFQQINIVNIEDPFEQEEGKIYWLGLWASWEGIVQWPVGWKTSQDHFMDAAVWWDYLEGVWNPLYDPRPEHAGERLDFAFVITPEPGTLALLAIGAVALIRRRRKA